MSTFDYDAIAASVLGKLEPLVEVSIRHNLAILRAIQWGAREVCSSDLEFDPRDDWWRRPERRFAIAFLTEVWHDWPADESTHPFLETLCVRLCSALDDLRGAGELTFQGFEYEQRGGLASSPHEATPTSSSSPRRPRS